MITRSLVAQCVIYAGTRGNLDIYLSWSGSPSKTFMLWRLDYKLRLSSDVKLLYLIYYLGDIHEPCDRFFFPFNFFFSAGKPQYLHPRINSLWSIWKKANNPPTYLEFSNAISTWTESPMDKKKILHQIMEPNFFYWSSNSPLLCQEEKPAMINTHIQPAGYLGCKTKGR